jgi:hypothetical protein
VLLAMKNKGRDYLSIFFSRIQGPASSHVFLHFSQEIEEMIEDEENYHNNDENKEHRSPEGNRDPHHNQQPGEDNPQYKRDNEQQQENRENIFRSSLHHGNPGFLKP